MADSSQRQTQTQSLNLTFNLGQNSADPELERGVFNEMYSAGSQIGRLTDVIALLNWAAEGSAVLQAPEAAAALAVFRGMQQKLGELKAARSPEQRLIAELNALRNSDPERYNQTRDALRQYLET